MTIEQLVLLGTFVLGAVVVYTIVHLSNKRYERTALDKTALLAKKLVKTSGLLLQEKKKMETILNMLSEKLAIIDFHGVITWENKPFSEVFSDQGVRERLSSLVQEHAQRGTNEENVQISFDKGVTLSLRKLCDEEGNHMAFVVLVS